MADTPHEKRTGVAEFTRRLGLLNEMASDAVKNTLAGTIGLGVDAINNAPRLVGLNKLSQRPFLGSDSISEGYDTLKKKIDDATGVVPPKPETLGERMAFKTGSLLMQVAAPAGILRTAAVSSPAVMSTIGKIAASPATEFTTGMASKIFGTAWSGTKWAGRHYKTTAVGLAATEYATDGAVSTVGAAALNAGLVTARAVLEPEDVKDLATAGATGVAALSKQAAIGAKKMGGVVVDHAVDMVGETEFKKLGEEYSLLQFMLPLSAKAGLLTAGMQDKLKTVIPQQDQTAAAPSSQQNAAADPETSQADGQGITSHVDPKNAFSAAREKASGAAHAAADMDFGDFDPTNLEANWEKLKKASKTNPTLAKIIEIGEANPLIKLGAGTGFALGAIGGLLDGDPKGAVKKGAMGALNFALIALIASMFMPQQQTAQFLTGMFGKGVDMVKGAVNMPQSPTTTAEPAKVDIGVEPTRQRHPEPVPSFG